MTDFENNWVKGGKALWDVVKAKADGRLAIGVGDLITDTESVVSLLNNFFPGIKDSYDGSSVKGFVDRFEIAWLAVTNPVSSASKLAKIYTDALLKFYNGKLDEYPSWLYLTQYYMQTYYPACYNSFYFEDDYTTFDTVEAETTDSIVNYLLAKDIRIKQFGIKVGERELIIQNASLAAMLHNIDYRDLQKNFLEYLLVSYEIEKEESRVYMVACPTDVTVLDESDNEVFTLRNNDQATVNEHGVFYLFGEDRDRKVLVLPPTYNIKISPTAAGTMSCDVWDSGFQALVPVASFSEVQLDMSETYLLNENNGEMFIHVVNDGNVVKTISADNKERSAPVILTSTLPHGTVKAFYSQTLVSTGDSPIIWSIESGNLPDGLTLNGDTGIISGTPTSVQTTSFTVKAENDAGEDARTFSIEINSDNENTSTGSTRSGGGGGGGFAPINPTPSPLATAVTAPLTSAELTKLFNEALAKKPAAQVNLTVKVQNKSSVSLPVLQEAQKLAEKNSVKLTLMMDQVRNNAVTTRITIDPAKATAGISTLVEINSKASEKATGIFKKWYQNNVFVISCDQIGSFGTPVKVIVKPPVGFKTDKLAFYSYNASTNQFATIKSANYQMDKNGYLHFTTTRGGDIIVSDGILTPKGQYNH